ncbi:hypothetical protein MATR_09320 [Marivirga tractuosa]|uniref:Lipoprotein n=1 Tax=Marivirga tractuosa (strain ATCC 23168 / DSM 4126 / NBRC 15989 / NCIMB 1408 / VKM B-1430 / H-43) TaxID=643867 RepID=E4TNK2_MARTH|nr:hypothetical protein [Marivirga tractuosa]ADR21439.1 hypothetical protein Ftrac_1449 [Marivirga tractuosa DSM 4126]BDD14107.1 hypothetical protein MATR_09320 [Marivirga tractuosa]
MRNIFLISITAFLFFSSCDIQEKLDKIATFDIRNSAEFTVPSASGINIPLDFPTPDINTSSEQSFENNNTSANLVENVNLTDLKLTITSPDGRTFSFLKSLEIYIHNNSEGSTLIAEIQDIPDNVGSVLDLQTTEANLDEYIKEDSYSLQFEAVTDETTNSETDISAEMIFEVKAKIL